MDAQRLRDQAQEGLILLKDAILQLLAGRPQGLSNAEIARILALHSDYKGAQKDYLTWSVLGVLLTEGKIVRLGRRFFFLAPSPKGETYEQV